MASKKPPGRPWKLTPQVHTKIIDGLAAGNYREVVAQVAGIHVATLYRWLEEGEADLENGKQTPQRELHEAVTRAEGEAETTAVEALRHGFKDDWRAAAEYLQRRHPKRWSKTDRHEVEVDQTVQHNVAVELVPEEEKRAEVARILSNAYGSNGN